MCGIVGAVSTRNIVPVLIEGLRRLEYRGYDSCGVAVHQGGQLRRARSTSRVAVIPSMPRMFTSITIRSNVLGSSCNRALAAKPSAARITFTAWRLRK